MARVVIQLETKQEEFKDMSEQKNEIEISLNPSNTGKQKKLIRDARYASLEGFTVFIACASVEQSTKLRNKIGYDSAHDITMITPKN